MSRGELLLTMFFSGFALFAKQFAAILPDHRSEFYNPAVLEFRADSGEWENGIFPVPRRAWQRTLLLNTCFRD